MLKYKTLEDRQILIEEIYAELEALLLKREGNAQEEEEEITEIHQNVEEEEDFDEETLERIRTQEADTMNPSEMTDKQKKKYFADLLAELEAKKLLLGQSLSEIRQIIKDNCM
ncbi:hypothetical protein TRFO_32594 [Tritrichomonas foetus]|uniref:Uncharacterized protein n=1 Tax=Tritrichomonas foetus TaxID=1144522 RepID=A0A1J4JQI5_9EUKA|nr:hypothetical protein TRFO_32594 [Tritrichomonas foetus]|eukprot:OHT00680.1 hypothetical protein TRFO_32594 [Tritrichomonas foetus]